MNPNTSQYLKTTTTRVVLLMLLAVLYWGCDNDVEVPDGAFDEKVVDLAGGWTVSSVLLNGLDITNRMEFARLQLDLRSDGGGPTDYTIENDGIPFLVTGNGDWSFDDDIYPTQIIFNSNGESWTASFASPPISGGNDFTLNFVLGCEDNLYTYRLTRQ